MPDRTLSVFLASPEATHGFARRLATRLRAGDVLLLAGPVGAGKTHFARGVIQALLDVPEDVPSPTYTLIQIYDSRVGDIWHVDLYRLSGPQEVVELGLGDAFASALCLVEWPDRLGSLAPVSALSLAFHAPTGDDTRVVTLSWSDPGWSTRLEGFGDG